jgi:hypothetical protein
LVLNAPLTVLFGASGLGKTSLVRAGLFPQLRKEHYLPVYVRLDLRDRGNPLIEQVKFALQTQLAFRRIDAPVIQGDELLWTYLHRAGLELWSEQNQLLTPCIRFRSIRRGVYAGSRESRCHRPLANRSRRPCRKPGALRSRRRWRGKRGIEPFRFSGQPSLQAGN